MSSGNGQVIIRVQDLVKTYRRQTGPRTLFREMLFGPLARNRLTALDGVSFQVQRGESFGVVGDNGAGKSTLLKILTGTCRPTSGQVQVSGSVGALLELGAGFHPEFTGRQNIFFSGAVMGISRPQIDHALPDIIEFSELQDSIDQPVKTYSTGMYVRLGFALATAFDPDVLIIDEALSVGDQSFQKKCIDRIGHFKKSGKTIFFCSHALHQVKTLCQRALWLESGQPKALGSAAEVVKEYEESARRPREGGAESNRTGAGSRQICWIEKAELERDSVHFGDRLELTLWSRFTPQFQGTPGVGAALLRGDGEVIYVTSTIFDRVELQNDGAGHYRTRLVFPRLSLLSGRYYFNVFTTDEEALEGYHVVEKAATFRVEYDGPEPGFVKLEHRWE